MKMRWTKVALHSVVSDFSDFRDRTVSFKVGVGGGGANSIGVWWGSDILTRNVSLFSDYQCI